MPPSQLASDPVWMEFFLKKKTIIFYFQTIAHQPFFPINSPRMLMAFWIIPFHSSALSQSIPLLFISKATHFPNFSGKRTRSEPVFGADFLPQNASLGTKILAFLVSCFFLAVDPATLDPLVQPWYWVCFTITESSSSDTARNQCFTNSFQRDVVTGQFIVFSRALSFLLKSTMTNILGCSDVVKQSLFFS